MVGVSRPRSKERRPLPCARRSPRHACASRIAQRAAVRHADVIWGEAVRRHLAWRLVYALVNLAGEEQAAEVSSAWRARARRVKYFTGRADSRLPILP